MKRQETENKERNVSSKYLVINFDFMRSPFWLNNYIVKINHRKYKSSSVPAFYVKVKGISLSLFKIIPVACFFVIISIKR